MTLTLTHTGHFSLPRGRQPVDQAVPADLHPYARFGFGGRAMCLDGSDLLWVSGHNVGDLVSPVSTAGDSMGSFRELAPVAARSVHRLDELVGVAYHEGVLCGLYQEYYDLDGRDGDRVSFWDGTQLRQLGYGGELKKHAGYLASHDGALWCGRSHGAGNVDVQHGPALYRIEPDLALTRFPIPPRADWTEVDRYTALVFLPDHVCWVVQKAVPTWHTDGLFAPIWYGQPDMPDKRPDWFRPDGVRLDDDSPTAEWREQWTVLGYKDPWSTGKGYHTFKREVWLLPYTWPGLEPQDPIVLPGFLDASQCGGAAFDPELGRLYVHELWPPATLYGAFPGEAPRVHTYDVASSEPDPAPTEPERDVITVTASVRGAVYTGTLSRKD